MTALSEVLQGAIRDYRLLLDKEYPVHATIKLVGDRYRLDRTERLILFRGVLDMNSSRYIHRKLLATLPPGSCLGIDGYNVLFTLINYKRGHALFIGTDGLLRDAGGAHGRFEAEADFIYAAELLCKYLLLLQTANCTIYLDAPVSHSGIHREILEEIGSRTGLVLNTETVPNADISLQDFSGTAIASSDSTVATKSASPIFDLARHILEGEYKAQFIDIGLYV